MNLMLEALKALLFGVVEGVTEWLPISSTGHMILLNEFVHMQMSDAFMEMFDVVIQLGAILAVVVLYFGKLWPFRRAKSGKGPAAWLKMDIVRLWVMVLVAIIPSAVIGLPLDDWMDAHLHTAPVVAAMLVLYGAAFIVIERWFQREPRVRDAGEIGVRLALGIGLFQALSLVPGTSRSGATILGAMLLGCSRPAAAEFSFYMAIPTMAGASLVKLLKFGFHFTAPEAFLLAIGCVTAFIVSIIAIQTFIGYIKRHSFAAFGWYRIALGALVALYFLFKG